MHENDSSFSPAGPINAFSSLGVSHADGQAGTGVAASELANRHTAVRLPAPGSDSILQSTSFDLVLGTYPAAHRSTVRSKFMRPSPVSDEWPPVPCSKVGVALLETAPFTTFPRRHPRRYLQTREMPAEDDSPAVSPQVSVVVPEVLQPQVGLPSLPNAQLPVVLPEKMDIGIANLNQFSHLRVGGGGPSAMPSSALLSSAPLTGRDSSLDPPTFSESKEYGISAHMAATKSAKDSQDSPAVVMVAAGALPLRPASPSERWPTWQVILLAVLVGCEYGIASTTISLSGRLLGKAHWNVAMQLNTVGRVAGCIGILGIEACRGKLLRGQAGTSLLDPRGWAVAFVSAAQTGIYIAVHFLASSGNVSVLLALTSLYNIVPPLYGIVRGGETVTKPKLAGFVAAGLAVALLSAASATSSGGGEPSQSSPLLQAILVAIAIIGWGVTDTIFSRIGKTMPSTSTAMWYAIGNAGFSIVLAQMGAATRQVTHDPSSITTTPTADSGSASSFGYFALLGTNVVAMAGWYGFITLGRVADASTFVPIVAAILTVTPSIVGTVFLGETFTAIMGAGVACAVISAVCMSLQRSSKKPAAQRDHKQSAHLEEDPRSKSANQSLMSPSASLASLTGALAPTSTEEAMPSSA